MFKCLTLTEFITPCRITWMITPLIIIKYMKKAFFTAATELQETKQAIPILTLQTHQRGCPSTWTCRFRASLSTPETHTDDQCGHSSNPRNNTKSKSKLQAKRRRIVSADIMPPFKAAEESDSDPSSE